MKTSITTRRRGVACNVSTFAIALFLAMLATSFTAQAQITYLDVGTTDTNLDATQNQNGTGWSWVAATNTFTLSGDIIGAINFYSGSGDVNFVVSGTPTVTPSISQQVGKLTISGGGTLNINNTANDASCLYVSNGDLAISNATVNINSSGAWSDGVFIDGHDLIMSSGTLTVTATGNASGGINTNGGGDLIISGTANVSATCDGYGIYMDNLIISGSAVSSFIGTGANGVGALVESNATISTSGTTQFTSQSTGNYAALRFVTDDPATLTLNGSGAVNVNATNRGIQSRGSFTIDGTGSGALNISTAAGYGAIASVYSDKTLTLSKTGGGISVTNTTGSAISSNYETVNINGADVTLNPGGAGRAVGGGHNGYNTNVTGGSLTANGNVGGNLTVSNGTASVTGNIDVNLTVSGGTVTVSAARSAAQPPTPAERSTATRPPAFPKSRKTNCA